MVFRKLAQSSVLGKIYIIFRPFLLLMKLILILLALFIVIAGCTSAPQKSDTTNAPSKETPLEVEKPVEKLPSKNVSAPVSKPVILKKSIDPAVNALLNKSSKVNSYKYSYYGPPNDGFGVVFFVVKDKIKISMPKNTKLSDNQYYDTIYLNIGKPEGTAYCEAADCLDAGRDLQIKFDEFYRPTPIDFVKTIMIARPVGTELIDGRKVTLISFTDNLSNNGSMWLDNTYGVPLKVKFDTSKYEYRDIFFNTLSSSDVIRK